MKLTKSKLKQLIKEELQNTLKEQAAAPKELTPNQMRKAANALCFKQGRVWFAGPSDQKTNWANARRNKQWRCPANDKLGYRDWAEARKLAAADDSAKFQQFMQSKKGGAAGAAGAPDMPSKQAIKIANDWLKQFKRVTYEYDLTPKERKYYQDRLIKLLKGYSKTGSPAMRLAAPAVLIRIKRILGGKAAAPEEKSAAVSFKTDIKMLKQILATAGLTKFQFGGDDMIKAILKLKHDPVFDAHGDIHRAAEWLEKLEVVPHKEGIYRAPKGAIPQVVAIVKIHNALRARHDSFHQAKHRN